MTDRFLSEGTSPTPVVAACGPTPMGDLRAALGVVGAASTYGARMGPSETDWASAEQEERRRPWWLLPAMAIWFGGFALTQRGNPFGLGGLGWVAVLAWIALVAALVAVAMRRQQVRKPRAMSPRAEAALRLHADPGPEQREIADRLARTYVWRWWFPLTLLYPPVALTVGGRWDSPLTTVCGGVLMVAALAVAFPSWRARSRAARRWREDPPGPPREMPVPTRAERWLPRLTGAGLTLVAIGWLLRAIGALVD